MKVPGTVTGIEYLPEFLMMNPAISSKYVEILLLTKMNKTNFYRVELYRVKVRDR